jgi:SAM-dependent methyltransferase
VNLAAPIAGSVEFFTHLASLKPSKAQKRSLEDLRRFLGPEREALPPGYMDQGTFLEAYQQYYLPLHLPELPWILDQASRFGLGPEPGATVLDLGSGPGTLSLAMALWAKSLSQALPHFTLVDRSKKSLDLAGNLLKLVDGDVQANFWVHDLGRVGKLKGSDRFDWIFAGHMLNEWGEDRNGMEAKKTLLDAVMRHLMHERSVFVVIEPPLREPTLDLMKLRDFWVRDLCGHVLLPCPVGTERCPALKSRLGWCYSKVPREWARSKGWAPLDDKVQSILGQELHYNGFSYAVFASSVADLDYFQGVDKNRRVAFSDERRRPSMWCRDSRIATSSRRPKHRGEIITPPAQVSLSVD